MAEYNMDYSSAITGSQPIKTTEVVLAPVQSLPSLTPMAQKLLDGMIYPYDPAANDGTEKALYLVPEGADLTTTAQRKDQVIKSGQFDPAKINWPAGTTDAQKLTAFAGSMISLQSPA